MSHRYYTRLVRSYDRNGYSRWVHRVTKRQLNRAANAVADVAAAIKAAAKRRREYRDIDGIGISFGDRRFDLLLLRGANLRPGVGVHVDGVASTSQLLGGEFDQRRLLAPSFRRPSCASAGPLLPTTP